MITKMFPLFENGIENCDISHGDFAWWNQRYIYFLHVNCDNLYHAVGSFLMHLKIIVFIIYVGEVTYQLALNITVRYGYGITPGTLFCGFVATQAVVVHEIWHLHWFSCCDNRGSLYTRNIRNVCWDLMRLRSPSGSKRQPFRNMAPVHLFKFASGSESTGYTAQFHPRYSRTWS